MTAFEYIDGMPCLSGVAKMALKNKLHFDFILSDSNRANLRVDIKMEMEKMINTYDTEVGFRHKNN